MQALLLSAGLGTRLDPLTRFVPKCLTPINGHPLLGIWLQSLVEAGFSKIFVNLHYMPDLVRDYVAQTPYADVVQWLYEPELSGTAGTLINCRELLDDSPLLLVHADNFSEFSPSAMWQAHADTDPSVSMTMMTFDTDAPSSCGIVEQDEHGKIIAFHEKVLNPPGRVANAAVYILDKSLIDSLHEIITDFSTQVIEANLANTQTWHNRQYHRDIGTVRSLLQVSVEYRTPLTSPVTEFWYQYWSGHQWHRLYQLAQQLAEQQQLPLLAPSALSKRAAAVVLVIENFSQEQWRKCVSYIDMQQSVVLIGAGEARTIANELHSVGLRYLLLVDR